MEIKESSPAGMHALENEGAIIIGTSIRNSYFKEKNLEQLLLWANEKLRPVYFMIPDLPAVNTLMACGETKENAEREARLKANSLENKCKAIIARLGFTNITILRWRDLVGNLQYLEAIVEIKNAYAADSLFQGELRKTTVEVISQNGSHDPTDAEIDMGVVFLLEELAFISRSTLILEQEGTVYVYHKTMQVLKDTLEGRYAFQPDSGVGFLTVN